MQDKVFQEEFESTPIMPAILTYISYAVTTLFGFIRDFMRNNNLDKTIGACEREDMKVSIVLVFIVRQYISL